MGAHTSEERLRSPKSNSASLLERTEVDPSVNEETELPVLARGAEVGRYVIMESIGSGGMGVVYAAYDPELDRKVALKLLHPGVEGSAKASAGRTRLQREAQALARLSHPNVIVVYDVGTYGARVFLAMEFVDGQTLGQWVKSRDWRAILEVYLRAGRGLAAAHKAGLVHRDFKPDNVLCGDDGRVRVLDFGLARAADEDATPSPIDDISTMTGSRPLDTGLTRAGAVIGTPRYMSPEQHLGLAADARSDQFSFCVSLYEGLYGERPFTGNSRETLAMSVTEGRLREVPTASPIPMRLRRVLLRGLSPHPEDRFASMEELLDALEKASRRRGPVLVAGGSFVAIFALLGWVLTAGDPAAASCMGAERKLEGVWDEARQDQIEQAFRATKRPFVEDAWRRVSTTLDAYTQAWVLSHQDACEATARGEQSQALLDRRMACLETARREVAAVSEVLVAADGKVVERSVRLVESLPPLHACSDLERLIAQPEPEPPDETFEKMEAEGRARLSAGDLVGATQIAEQTLEHARAGERPHDLIRARLLLAAAHAESSRRKEAVPLLWEAAALADAEALDGLRAQALIRLVHELGHGLGKHEQVSGLVGLADGLLVRLGDPADWRRQLLMGIGGDALRAGDLDEAERNFLAARDLDAPMADSVDIELLNNLGIVARRRGDFAAALAHYDRALERRIETLGAEHPLTAATLNNRANVYVDLERLNEALEDYQRVLQIEEKNFGRNHESLAATLNNLGVTLDELGRDREALEVHRRGLALREQIGDPDDTQRADALENVATVMAELDEREEARPLYEQALEIRQRVDGEHHPTTAATRLNIGLSYDQAGDHRKAIELYELSLADFEAAVGEEHPVVAVALVNLGDARVHLSQFALARENYQRALAIFEKFYGPDHADCSYALVGLGLCALGEGRQDEAIELIERALELREKDPGGEVEIARVRFALARALARKNPERAAELAEQAAKVYRERHPGRPETVAVEKWLERR